MSYAVKRGGSAVAYCALSIRCGTRDEAAYPDGRRDRSGYHSGIAHFTEHTLFKGTTRRTASSISGYLDRLGGELNAYTTKEEIVIHATVLKEDLRKAMSLLMELATSPTFPENAKSSTQDFPGSDRRSRYHRRSAGLPSGMPADNSWYSKNPRKSPWYTA